MNRSIRRLFVVMIALITVLIVFTARWTVINHDALQANSLNRLDYYASLKIKRGEILAADGKVLALSKRATADTWARFYPFGTLFAQAVGYANPELKQFSGLESYRNAALSGKLQTGLSSVFGTLHSTTAGDQVTTTLDYKAQKLAQQQLADKGYQGSVVALVPQTGAVKVMYSNPGYDANQYEACAEGKIKGCSLVNNAVAGVGFPPGSTFKVVTAAAALDSGKYTPTSVVNGHSPITVSGTPLANDNGDQYGDVTLTTALTNSINTVFAQVGLTLGASTLQTYMQRFGFYSVPPLDYPVDEMSASGPKLYEPKSRSWGLLAMTNPLVDVGRTAIGQAKLLVTPLQMAMVASAVANGGVLMEPRLTSSIVNQDGQSVQSINPTVDDRVMKSSTAAELRTMMRNVVEEGTGQAANLDGLDIAGKTGTASVCTQCSPARDDAWFIGFAPVNSPKIAVAVELTNIPNGYGGQFAAPIAAEVIKLLLAEGQ